MVIGTFYIPKAKDKDIKTRDAIDVAARYFVYKLSSGFISAPQPSRAWAPVIGHDE